MSHPAEKLVGRANQLLSETTINIDKELYLVGLRLADYKELPTDLDKRVQDTLKQINKRLAPREIP